jgi:hypothetical protein
MNEEFRAYYHSNDGAYSQQKTVSVIDGHSYLSRSDFTEQLLCRITPSQHIAQVACDGNRKIYKRKREPSVRRISS